MRHGGQEVLLTVEQVRLPAQDPPQHEDPSAEDEQKEPAFPAVLAQVAAALDLDRLQGLGPEPGAVGIDQEVRVERPQFIERLTGPDRGPRRLPVDLQARHPIVGDALGDPRLVDQPPDNLNRGDRKQQQEADLKPPHPQALRG